MSAFGSVVIFIIIWWVILFTVLPWRVNSQIETEAQIVPGSDPGAPEKGHLWIKFLITTGITAFIWGILFFLFYYDVVTF